MDTFLQVNVVDKLAKIPLQSRAETGNQMSEDREMDRVSPAGRGGPPFPRSGGTLGRRDALALPFAFP